MESGQGGHRGRCGANRRIEYEPGALSGERRRSKLEIHSHSVCALIKECLLNQASAIGSDFEPEPIRSPDQRLDIYPCRQHLVWR